MQIAALYQKYLECTGVTTDTRNVGTGNIFFALKGEKFNGNLFAAGALEHGAKYAVVEDSIPTEWKGKYSDRLIPVENVLKTLQLLAAFRRKQLRCPVLAITGSNGKTTTKELVTAVLSKKYKTYATRGNMNNHIGIPLTLLAIKPDAEFAVVEMGANHQGEIASYCEYAQPDYGLITNVGLAHIEGFGSLEGVIKGKTELYNYLGPHAGTIFVSSENSTLRAKIPNSAKAVTYGTAPDAFCRGGISGRHSQLAIIVPEGDKKVSIQTQFFGDYNFENVMAALCVGKYFGVETEQMKQAIEAYEPSNNRSQQIAYGTNTVILDAYNANPASMMEALKNFERISAENKIVILGEMMELGELSITEHEKIAAATDKMHLSKRIFTGEGFKFLKNKPGVMYFESSDGLAAWFAQQKIENSWLLVKGSRKNELEKLFKW